MPQGSWTHDVVSETCSFTIELRISSKYVSCMAHARRKFFDSLPKDKARESDATSVARQGIHYCDQIFSLERSWKDLSAEERYKKRQSELKPLLKKFSDWCYKKSVSVLPSGKLGAYIVLMLPFLCINPLFCDYNWCNENCSTKGKRKLTPIAIIN